MLSDGDLQIDKRTHAEFQFEEWYDSETQGSDMDEKKRLPLPPKERVFKRRRTIDEGDFTLVHRSKDPTNVDVSSESEFSSDTDDDGFQLVHRPKLHIDSVVNSPEAAPSSPESASPPLPVPSVDLLAAIAALRRDSDDEDEDNGASSDWSFV
jgi:hypothetical protein